MGGDASVVRSCARCGRSVTSERARFCPDCGMELSALAPGEAAGPAPQVPTPSGFRQWLALGLLVLLVAAPLVGLRLLARDHASTSDGGSAEGEAGFETLWREPVDGDVTKPPIVNASAAIAVAADGRVTSLDRATGERLWEGAAQGSDLKPAVLAEDTLYLATSNFETGNAIYAIDATTGEERWNLQVDMGFPQPPVVVEDVVYAAAERVVALSAADGTELWSSAPMSFLTGPPVVAGEIVIACAEDVFAFDSTTGEKLWRAPISCQNVAVEDEVAVVEGFKKIFALDLAGGEELWTHRLRQNLGAPVFVSEDLVFLSGNNGEVTVLDLFDGRQRWRKSFEDSWFDPPTVHEDVLYVTDPFRGLVSVDLATGEELWSYEDDLVSITGFALAENAVVVADGDLTVLDTATGELQQTIPVEEEAMWDPVLSDGVLYVVSRPADVRITDESALVAIDASELGEAIGAAE